VRSRRHLEQEKEFLGKGSEIPKERHEQAANSEGSQHTSREKAVQKKNKMTLY